MIVESWIEFGIACIITFYRITSRLFLLGWRKLGPHDYLAVFILFCYCANMILEVLDEQIYAKLATDAAMPNHDTQLMITLTDTANKYHFAQMILYVAFVWAAKASLLFYYGTFTYLRLHRYLLWMSVICCIVTLIILLGIILGHCPRIADNWQSQSPGYYQCQETKYSANLIHSSIYTCHAVSDLSLLVVPIPVIRTILDVGLSMGRKLFLATMLCSGIFTVIAATVVFTQFQKGLNPETQQLWARREIFVWVLLINIPSIASIFKGKILLDPATEIASI